MNLKPQNAYEYATTESVSLFRGLRFAIKHWRSPFTALLLAIGMFVGTVFTLDFFCSYWVENAELKAGTVAAIGVNPAFDTFQGSILQKMAFQNPKILPIYGSSEMSMIYDYHPAKVFTPETGLTPFLIGKGGTQTLIHVLNIAALGEEVRGKKLAIFLTPQWYGTGGISQATFEGNFSALHAYSLLKNSSLSPQLKQQIAVRLLQFPKAYQDFPFLEKMLAVEAKSSWSAPVSKLIYSLPAQIEYAGLAAQDAEKTAWQVQKLPKQTIAQYAPRQTTRIQWDKLRAEAIEKGKTDTDNNPFGMDNGFYASNIGPKLQERKDSDKNTKYSSSPEYEDLKILMAVLKEKGAKPLFVILPMNGRWTDYTGISAEERQGCYSRLAQMIKTEGFALADFSAHEKDDYYLRDPWHLAWKGWVDVDEVLDHFYHNS